MAIHLTVFTIFGGLGLFLFSIGLLSNTLKSIASYRLKKLLEKATGNPLKGALSGMLVTFLVQSSSVTVLVLLGLVNAGILNLRQAVYIILGSEIGTTITAQIVAFKIQTLFYPLIAVGFVLRTASEQEKVRNLGNILFSLGLVFLAMKIMTEGARPLKELPVVLETIASLGAYPLLGILCGAVFTAITNSSSATTSMVIALSMEEVIDLAAGVAVIIGANIGTCVLELIAVVGTNAAARRTGVAQFCINIGGTILFFPFLEIFAELIAHTAADVPRQIANAHTVFNVSVSLILMPFVNVLVVFLEKVVQGKGMATGDSFGILDSRFLAVPTLALSEAEVEIHRMAKVAGEMIQNARKALLAKDKDALKLVKEQELLVDSMQQKISLYLNQISTISLSVHDGRKKKAFVHIVTDLERVADLTENIAEYAEQEEVLLSDSALRELDKFFERAAAAYSCAIEALLRNRKSLALEVYPLEKKVNNLEKELRQKYFARMSEMTTKPLRDALYPNILRDLERISDHSENIAEHVLEL